MTGQVTRREFLGRAAVGAAISGASLWSGRAFSDASLSARPNILWLTCEDMSPNLGCYGDAYAITPTLDGLARKGIRYANAFSVAGVCAPSRSCLITGVYPWTLGSQHMRSDIPLPAQMKCFTEHLRQASYYCTNNVKTDYNFRHPASAWDESSPRAHWRSRGPGRRFFSVFNFTVTHETPINAPAESFLKATARLTPDQCHDPAKADIPPYHPDTPKVRKTWAQYADAVTLMDMLVGDKLKELEYVICGRDRIGPRRDMVRAIRDRKYRYIRNFLPQLPWYCGGNRREPVQQVQRELNRLEKEGGLSGPPARYQLSRSRPPVGTTRNSYVRLMMRLFLAKLGA